MRRIFFSLLTLLALLSQSAWAETEDAQLDIAGDVFRAGETASHDSGTAKDVFLAGETVRVTAPVTENAHLAGRWITVDGPIGGDLYAAGMEITARAPVTGDISVAGYEITLPATGGDLRVTGSQVTIGGAVAGYALVTAEHLNLDGPVTGDIHATVRSIEFGPDARVDGRLVLYETEPGTIEVPDAVAPADRIERRDLAEWDAEIARYRDIGWSGMVARFLMGLLVVAGLAALAAALIPGALAAMRARLLDDPLRSLWFGFLAHSAMIGAVVILIMTVLGLFFAPAVAILAVLAGFAGYVIGVYALGVAILRTAGRPIPENWTERAIAGGIGAVIAGLVGLIPFFGWLVVLALTLTGLGAAVLHFLRPRFFA